MSEPYFVWTHDWNPEWDHLVDMPNQPAPHLSAEMQFGAHMQLADVTEQHQPPRDQTYLGARMARNRYYSALNTHGAAHPHTLQQLADTTRLHRDF